jgi:hypothetical protein
VCRHTSEENYIIIIIIILLVTILYILPVTKGLKGQCHEIFHLWIFLQTTSPGPSRHVQQRFRFFSNIRGYIRLFWCFAGVNDTGEANDFFIVG